ncbi:MAG TPA: hypothetical protein VHW95_10995 [Steroidobacteraceae bacterium]|jgi:hypothetical protein|nr:hypothetical protein [Steroidobacteraceae bacterium]
MPKILSAWQKHAHHDVKILLEILDHPGCGFDAVDHSNALTDKIGREFTSLRVALGCRAVERNWRLNFPVRYIERIVSRELAATSLSRSTSVTSESPVASHTEPVHAPARAHQSGHFESHCCAP